MATYNRPGVYVNELPLAAAPINGALAAQAAGACIAAFPQGPDSVTKVTSWYDFVKKFGGYSKRFPATFAVGSFFKNGGTELYVKRVLPSASRKVAKVTVPGSANAALGTFTINKIQVSGTTATITTSTNHGIVYPATSSMTLTGFSGAHAFLNGVKTITATPAANTVQFTVTPTSIPITNVAITSNVATVTAPNHGITFATQIVTITGVTNESNLFNSNPTWTLTGAPTTNTVTFALTNANVTSAAATGTLPRLAYTLQIAADTTPIIAGTTPAKVAYTYTDTNVITLAAKNRGTDGNNLRVKFVKSKAVRDDGYYDLTVYYEAGVADTIAGGIVTGNFIDDTIVEQFNGIVLNDVNSGDYIVNVLEFGSAYIEALEGPVVEYNDAGVAQAAVEYVIDRINSPIFDTIYPLSGAPDPELPLTYADYTGNTVYDPFTSTGTFNVDDCTYFTEFEVINNPLVFFLPDVIDKISDAADSTTISGWARAQDVYRALIEWVEAPKTVGRNFVVVETPAGLDVNTALARSGDMTLVTESSRAAVYYPHFYIQDPIGRSSASVRRIGPSGAVAGLFLYTDRKVGPFKTPAGIDTKLVDAIALERSFSATDLDALNTGVTTDGISNGKNVINAIRNLPGAGIVVMGGRTLKQDGTANRYINMRRSLTYLEKRLNDLATFAVFENNTEKLWARLITTLGSFLNEYRNQGGLRGTTTEQSYYIKCDAENNTPTTIQAGEVHIEIGVALEYPAEFVVINLSQKTAE
jgi:hypothetical protein